MIHLHTYFRIIYVDKFWFYIFVHLYFFIGMIKENGGHGVHGRSPGWILCFWPFGNRTLGRPDGSAVQWAVESHECADCGERSRTAGNDGTCRIDRQDRSWRARELEMPPLDDP